MILENYGKSKLATLAEWTNGVTSVGQLLTFTLMIGLPHKFLETVIFLWKS